jgi:signal transduction histidine kinase
VIPELSSCATVDRACEITLANALKAAGARSALVYLFSRHGSPQTIVRSLHVDAETLRRVEDGELLVGGGVDAALRRGEVVHVHGLTDWTDRSPASVWLAHHEHASSFEAYPLASAAGIAGALVLFHAATLRADDAHRRHCRVLARLCGDAFERLQLTVRERRARADAEEASKGVGLIMAKVSHELRDPLNAVSGWVRLLRMTSPSEELARRLDLIMRSLDMQKHLIDDLIEFSRFRAGAIRLDRVETSLDTIVEAAMEIVRMHADAKGVELVASPSPVMLWCDRYRLQQVLVNLLSNAVKFTPGGGRVAVEAREAGAAVEIVVRDSGRGIPAQLIERVFDPFDQGEGGLEAGDPRPGSRGVGLGLAVVRELVELHGGRVTAEAGTPRGTTIRVVLPRGM